MVLGRGFAPVALPLLAAEVEDVDEEPADVARHGLDVDQAEADDAFE